MNDQRYMDKWLKYAAILGPFLGYLFGIASGAIIVYQAYKQDRSDITLLFGWKHEQEEFNFKTVAAISRLKALVRDSQP